MRDLRFLIKSVLAIMRGSCDSPLRTEAQTSSSALFSPSCALQVVSFQEKLRSILFDLCRINVTFGAKNIFQARLVCDKRTQGGRGVLKGFEVERNHALCDRSCSCEETFSRSRKPLAGFASARPRAIISEFRDMRPLQNTSLRYEVCTALACLQGRRLSKEMRG